MTEIRQLSPALSLALLHFTDRYDASPVVFRDMLKATFFELLLGRVLVASTEKKLFAKVTYINRGPAFNSHRFEPHQMAFQSCLPNTRKMKDYIRQVYRKAQGSFADAIMRQLQEMGLIVPVPKKALFISYKGWALTATGYELKSRLQMALDDGQRFAAYGYQVPPLHLRQYTAFMGLNVVLLASFSPLLMQQWNQIMAKLPRPDQDSGSYADTSDSSWDDWSSDGFIIDIFGSFSDSDFSAGFESAFDSGGSGSDWGGGSDSGDSGDSGDGGDGGGDGGGD